MCLFCSWLCLCCLFLSLLLLPLPLAVLLVLRVLHLFPIAVSSKPMGRPSPFLASFLFISFFIFLFLFSCLHVLSVLLFPLLYSSSSYSLTFPFLIPYSPLLLLHLNFLSYPPHPLSTSSSSLTGPPPHLLLHPSPTPPPPTTAQAQHLKPKKKEKKKETQKNSLPKKISTTFGLSLSPGPALAATCAIRSPGYASTWLSLMLPAEREPTMLTSLPPATRRPRRA